MQVTSTAFADGGAIPNKYTQDGAGASPPLAFSDIPAGTKSLALIVDDPDAPDPEKPRDKPFVHWVLADLPPNTTKLPEAVTQLPGGTVGKNDFDNTKWDGPAPPVGQHRYCFKLYALDRVLNLKAPDKAKLESAMKGHIIEQAELVGTYKKAA